MEEGLFAIIAFDVLLLVSWSILKRIFWNTLSKDMLDVKNLVVEFDGSPPLRAVDGIDLVIREGEILGLVGESGSGKTVLSLALLRLISRPGKIAGGAIYWKGRDLLSLGDREIQQIRGGEIAMIFQNPQASLNPVRTIGHQFRALLKRHHGFTGEHSEQIAWRWLKEVGIPDPEHIMASYSFQLSGGLCQRVMIAMALSCQPKLLIADEPTASLDVTIQAQIMELLLVLRERFGMAILLISHDLGVVARLSDRVAVMYLGRIVELADAVELYGSPKHPYTKALLGAIPVPDPLKRDEICTLTGEMPDQRRLTVGACRFRSRCPVSIERCGHVDPQLYRIGDEDHWAACILQSDLFN